MNSWNIKCKKEKDEAKSDEIEKCVKQTSVLESQLQNQHQDKMDDHKDETDKMI